MSISKIFGKGLPTQAQMAFGNKEVVKHKRQILFV